MYAATERKKERKKERFLKPDVNTSPVSNGNRTYGLDLLRIISMVMIVMIHMISNNPFTDTAYGFPYRVFALDFLNTLTRTAVNCFALLSGYLMVNRTTKYSKMASMILQTVFYSLSFTVLSKILHSDALTFQEFISALLPATTNLWWYYSCYFILFFFVPYINQFINSLTKREFTALLTVVLFLFCVRPTITLLFTSDYMATNGGFSVTWLFALYIIGAYLKKYDIANMCKIKYAVVAYSLCFVFTHFVPDIIDAINLRFGTELSPISLGDDPSVNIMVMSVSFFIIFAKIKVPKIFHKPLQKLSDFAFAVYIIHEHPFVRYNFISWRFAFIGEMRAPFIVAGVICFSILIYLACCIVETLRLQLFKLIGMEKVETYLAHGLEKITLHAKSPDHS